MYRRDLSYDPIPPGNSSLVFKKCSFRDPTPDLERGECIFSGTTHSCFVVSEIKKAKVNYIHVGIISRRWRQIPITPTETDSGCKKNFNQCH